MPSNQALQAATLSGEPGVYVFGARYENRYVGIDRLLLVGRLGAGVVDR
jgi:hypothetical protein